MTMTIREITDYQCPIMFQVLGPANENMGFYETEEEARNAEIEFLSLLGLLAYVKKKVEDDKLKKIKNDEIEKYLAEIEESYRKRIKSVDDDVY